MSSGALEEGPAVCLGRWQGGLSRCKGRASKGHSGAPAYGQQAEVNAGGFVLGSHLASALVWISQSLTLLGLRRLDADSNFMRISTLPGTLRPKDPGGENRTHLCT